MRKILSFVHMSLDSYVAVPDGDLAWITYNDELAADASQLSDGASAALYGRITYHDAPAADAPQLSNGARAALYGRHTYQLMEAYWPTVPDNPNSTAQERHHAAWVEQIHKIVFSRTLDRVTWHNTTLIKDNIAAEVNALKQQGEGYMMIFGSPTLTHALAQLDLIDEYRININPVSLGRGIPLFAPVVDQGAPATNLTLLDARTMAGVVVATHYARVR